MKTPITNSSSRREFIKHSTVIAAGAAAVPLLLNTKSSAAAPGDTLRVGLIGCGGRGTGAAKQALNADKNVVLTAMGPGAEQFRGRIDNTRVFRYIATALGLAPGPSQ